MSSIRIESLIVNGKVKWRMIPCPVCGDTECLCGGHDCIDIIAGLSAHLEQQAKADEPPAASAPPFAPGDVVRLKCGGPRMLVEEVDNVNGKLGERSLALCLWTSDKGLAKEWIDVRWLEKP